MLFLLRKLLVFSVFFFLPFHFPKSYTHIRCGHSICSSSARSILLAHQQSLFEFFLPPLKNKNSGFFIFKYSNPTSLASNSARNLSTILTILPISSSMFADGPPFAYSCEYSADGDREKDTFLLNKYV